jgi:hypothetical protein
MPENQESRDILIELRADVRHIRQTMENFRQSDLKQWDQIDALGREVEGHKGSISFLTKGFWVGITAIVACGGSIVAWVVKHQ